MAFYYIIGGDGKQYGPVTEADVRQWIAEYRLNSQSLAKPESDAEFRALAQFPEFAEALAGGIPEPIAPLPRSAADYQARDYEMDIMVCFSEGWQLLKNNFGMLLMSAIVLLAVSMVFFGFLGMILATIVPKNLLAIPLFKVGCNFLLSVAGAFIMGPLVGGFYLVFLRLKRGQPADLSHLFAGFQNNFSQLSLGYLFVVLVTGLCMAPYSYVNTKQVEPLLLQMQSAQPTEVQTLLPQLLSAFAGTLPILLLCLIPVTYLTVNWLFTQTLIIDKKMDFSTAMKTSWKCVSRHWWHVFGLVVFTGLLNVAGFCACCVGLAVTFPLGIAALMIAYETIFGTEGN